jgi:hypothetical protein
MKIEVSIGEVIDKITILQIKEEKIKDDVKLLHIRKELNILNSTLLESNINVPQDMTDRLKDINTQLWNAEDILREKESIELYDDEFVKCAVLDSVLNDKRFLVKNEINNFCDSDIKEQKSYEGLYKAEK